MSVSLHVRHEVTPDRVYAVLQGLSEDEPIDHVVQADRQITRLRQLGLLDQNKVSPLGSEVLAICRRKPDLWGDLGHYLHYTLWDSDTNKQSGFSWTYKQFTDAAWGLGTFGLTVKLRETITSSLINQAEAEPDIDFLVFKKQAASISRDSLNGVVGWLSALIPPVVTEKKQFQRRNFCSPELLLLAVSHSAKMSGADLGIDLLLTPQRREAICRLCVLEPAALDRTLDWMMPVYSHIVVPGTTAGTYGRFLRFLKWPTMSDLLPGAG